MPQLLVTTTDPVSRAGALPDADARVAGGVADAWVTVDGAAEQLATMSGTISAGSSLPMAVNERLRRTRDAAAASARDASDVEDMVTPSRFVVG